MEGTDDRMVGEVTVELRQGDLVHQPDLEAIANAAAAHLGGGGGVDGAIHRAAGKGLAREARPLGPIRPGECVRTGGHGLPNSHVLHCLGPVYGRDEPAAELLGNCYRNALRLADEWELTSVGFPAISTGVFRYPMDEAAEVALAAVSETAPGLEHVRLVRFVLFGEAALDAHRDALAHLAQ